MAGVYPDYSSRVEDYTAKRTLGRVMFDRVQEFLELPSEDEVLEYFNIKRPRLNNMADFLEWNRRLKRLKMRMIQEKFGDAYVPRSAGDGSYSVK